MSDNARLVRKAADEIRHDVGFGHAHGDPPFLLAVAAWLEQAARLHEEGSTGPLDLPAARAVANAYLSTWRLDEMRSRPAPPGGAVLD